jgi:hypothetical protein
MTETQATSGTASAGTGQPHSEAAPETGEKVQDGGTPASGGEDTRNAVGRASVPADRTAGGTPKFTRAPGMAPPPDSLTVPIQSPPAASGKASVSGPPSSGVPVTSAPPAGYSIPPVGGGPVISAPPTSGGGVGSAGPAVARASVRAPAAPPGTGTMGLGRTGQTGVSGSARVTEAVRAARKTVSAAVGRGPRRARLHVKRIDPWSVMKFAFAVSFVLFVVLIVATSVLYLALDAMGVFQSVNKTLQDMIGATGGDSSGAFKITAKGVIGGAALLGLVNVVLFTALATLGAFIYNVCADLVGGIEVTLAEKE